ncbi:hypothetical protein [Aliiroseovarius subalbicans]|uniref:hypothetical protein n=1 Tax=Aliiroseovarius subalbicans TaxID=2925840 RepID=UPI001F56CA8A|nr:hypothetical protein [Aliiroseovarius subalbicans]MCI2398703.1 hypothetical protein [Aliiroseovarius subalbicans]
MRYVILSVVVAVSGLVGAAMAEPMDGAAAKKVLFSPKGLSVQALDVSGLSGQMQAQIAAIVAQASKRKVLKQYELAGYSYYGALAVPTDQALTIESLVFAAQLHSPEAAQTAAVDSCATQTGSQACKAILLLLPKKFKPRALTLNAATTQLFRDSWTKGDGPRVLAISTGTLASALAKGEGSAAAALERCNARASEKGQPDCVVAIAED